MKTFIIDGSGNWTANDLLNRIAKKNGLERAFIEYGKQLVKIDGVLYDFDHVKSIDENPVTVYLKEYHEPQPHYGTPGWYKNQIQNNFDK